LTVLFVVVPVLLPIAIVSMCAMDSEVKVVLFTKLPRCQMERSPSTTFRAGCHCHWASLYLRYIYRVYTVQRSANRRYRMTSQSVLVVTMATEIILATGL